MSGQGANFERNSTVAVRRGLHVVRYAASKAPSDFPIAQVRPAPGSESLVEVISAPGAPMGVLDRPGACLVVRAHGEAQLIVALRRSAPNGSLDASFQIDPLGGARVEGEASAEVAPPAPARSEPQPEPAPAKPIAFDLVAHVAMRGDVSAHEGEWVAGPSSPAAIEGVTFRSSEPERLSIEAQVRIAGSPQWSPWIPAGAYAGTKGRGLPLAGLRLRLVGAEAAQADLAVDALFLGAVVQSKTGRQIEFANSTGSEPLVGLKLSVKRTEKAQGARSSEAPAQDLGSRVRVYRSSGDTGRPAT